MSDESGTSHKPIAEGMHAALEPVVGFCDGFRSVYRPDFPFTGPGSSSRVIKFLLGSMLIGSLIELILPSEAVWNVSPSPFLNDTLLLIAWMLAGFVVAMLIHSQLKKAGGRGTFAASYIPYLYLTGIYYPVQAVVLGTVALTGYAESLNSPITFGLLAMQVALYGQLLARTHAIDNKVAGKWAGLGVIGAAVIVGVPLLLLSLPGMNADRLQGIEEKFRNYLIDQTQREEMIITRYWELVDGCKAGVIPPSECARKVDQEVRMQWSNMISAFDRIAPNRNDLSPLYNDLRTAYEVRGRAFSAAVEALRLLSETGTPSPQYMAAANQFEQLWDEAEAILQHVEQQSQQQNRTAR